MCSYAPLARATQRGADNAGKVHQQTAKAWHGAKLNSRWPAVFRPVLYPARIDFALERRTTRIGGIEIERPREIALDALDLWKQPVLCQLQQERSDGAIGPHSG